MTKQIPATQLITALQGHGVSLEKAIFSGALSDVALHLFAHDCAYRSLLAESGWEIPRRLFKTLRIKRGWLEGSCTEKSLREARQSTHDLLRELRTYFYRTLLPKSYPLSSKHVVQAVVWATALEGEDAAENAAREVREAIALSIGRTREQEERWQRERLALVARTCQLTERWWLLYEEDWRLPFERPRSLELDCFDG